MDITRSGQINFRTWVLMLSSLSPEAHPDEKVAFAFSLYDSNDDGYIDKSDIVNLLTSSITDLSVDDVRVLINRSFELADYDKDSRINVADYKLLVCMHLCAHTHAAERHTDTSHAGKEFRKFLLGIHNRYYRCADAVQRYLTGGSFTAYTQLASAGYLARQTHQPAVESGEGQGFYGT
uniref:Calcineurin B-like protein 4 n=1 Tax=Lygus hesperus TaxID=30085 RepID=A0A0A9WDD8_LYGHE